MPTIKRQDSARAIIIGVSAYDDKNVKALECGVRDAIAYANWLLSIGVPREKIVLHVSPFPGEEYDFPEGVERMDATRDQIWRSFAALMNEKNDDRLYVCASGHGVQTRAGTCFLTQDFQLEYFTDRNICIDLYIDNFLRSLNFSEQYLFIDCCSNYLQPQNMIQLVTSGGPGHEPPKRTKTQIHAFFACQETERAQQDAQGRGIFTKALLDHVSAESLDDLWLEYEGKRYFSFDFDKGIWRFDFLSLFVHKVVSEVEGASVDIGRRFRPRYVPAPAYPGGAYLFDLEGEQAASLTISAKPEADLKRLKRVKASLPAVQPELIKRKPTDPFSIKAPIGRTIKIYGDPANKDEKLVDRPLKATIAASDGETVYLKFASPHAPETISGIKTDAYSTRRIADAAREGLGRTIAGGIFGLGVPAGATGSPPVGRVGRPTTPKRASPPKNLVIRRAKPISDRIEEGLSSWAELKIRDLQSDLVKEVKLSKVNSRKSCRVEPGRYLAEIDLPWGSWRQFLIINTDEKVDLEIPNRTGRPPLRFEPDEKQGATWNWHLKISEKFIPGRPYIAAFDDILIRRSIDDKKRSRFEPFSATRSPLWDILITNKRPEMASTEMLSALVDNPPEDLTEPCLGVLRLGAAYASLLESELELAAALYKTLPEDLQGSLDGRLIDFGLSGGEDAKHGETIVESLIEECEPLLNYGYDVAARWLPPTLVDALIPLDDNLGGGAWTTLFSETRETEGSHSIDNDDDAHAAELNRATSADAGEQDPA